MSRADVGHTAVPTGAQPPFRCSSAARERVDPLAGSAAPARRWLLIEEPGPWAEVTMRSGLLRGAVGTALGAAALSAGARILLIRRPGRVARHAHRSWAVVDPQQGIQWGRWSSPPELLPARLPLLGELRPDGEQGPLFLVCTHARRDVCCAVRGRPVATALAARWPDQTWHCSHLGGDRFAANVLVVPDGSTYGQLEPDRVVETMESHLHGAVDASHLRGVSTHLPVVQAAVVEALRRWGPAGVPDVTPLSSTVLAPDEWLVELAGRGRLPPRVTAVVRRRVGPEVALTCRADAPSRAYEYVVRWASGASATSARPGATSD